jgi:transposase
MQVVHEVCCGLDVHKKRVTACVLWASGRRRQTREFGTFTRELLELADWLRASGVTHVALESTGVYWKPVWNLLEGQFDVLLVNAQHIKAVPGRKTDQKDSEWIADLLQHGLLRASFVPPTPTRELRDLTRYRASLAQEINRIANRMQKVLEDANIKLASVATDTLGASGRAMLEAIVNGEQDSQRLAEMSRGLLRNKIPQLQQALEGRVTAHHRFLLRELLDHHYFVESKMRRIEQEVAERLGPFQSEVARLCTIPGVDRVTAWGLLAEIGLDMSQFPDAQHLASWAGLCPGSHESAGKRKSGKIRKGSLWLRRCLCQGAWAVSTKKNNYLSALYRRLAARRRSKRATIAVAHNLLVIRLLHSARQDLLPRPRPRLLRSSEPRRPAPTLNQTTGRIGLQGDLGAYSPTRLEAIF